MKAEFLKLAGVKTEKAFYKKYPTEAAFFKAHPEAKKMIKKAQVGADVNKNGIPDYLERNPQLNKNQFITKGSSIGSFYQTPKAGTPYPGTMFKPFGIPQQDYNILKKPSADMSDPEAPVFQNVDMPLDQDINFVNQVTEAKDQEYAPLSDKKSGGKDFWTKASPYAGYIGQFVGGIQNLEADTIKTKYKEQWANVSDPVAKAAGLRPELRERRYVRPEDNILQPDQRFPSYGMGTNVLSARDGAEIQNTYAPGYLYDDLGYEPLDDSEQIKQYIRGGNIPQAQTGFETFMTGGGGQMLTGLADYGTGNNAGGQIGGALGGAAGMAIGGPAGGMVGQTLGTLAGGMLDPNARKQKKAQEKMMRNLDSAIASQTSMQLQNQFSSVMERGGQITNPQVIAKFGEYSMDDLLAPPKDADMLRAGGHLSKYTPPSQRAMQQYAMGGEVQTTWGGHAETMSHNPYLPGTGETIMFRGQSHDESDGNGNTGIGVKYGKGVHDSYTNYAEYGTQVADAGTQVADADVEVERGEPAMELQEPNGDTNLTVFGNLKIPNAYIPILGDEKAKGKKFKNYVAELSKQEKKQNDIIEKSTSILDALELGTSFDKLKLASLQANVQGANMKLKEIADRKMNAASLQSAINDTAEEYGLDADALAKGRAKMDPNAFEEYAEKGKTVKKQKGTTTNTTTVKPAKYENPPKPPKSIPYTQAGSTGNPEWDNEEKYDQVWTPSVKSAFSDKNRAKKMLDYITNYSGEGAEEVRNNLNTFATEQEKLDFLMNEATNKKVGPIHRIIKQAMNWTSITPTPLKKEEPAKEVEKDKNYDVVRYKRNPLVDIYNQILPYIRPTDQEDLDPMQLAGEMYALSTNQLEPVQAQTFQPELDVPYDISLQDQLNANQSDYRAAQRMVGYNPAAQAMLNAQKYEANSKVLGEQFRMNQGMKNQVYSKNRDILNDAKLKNLAIYDQQYQRQAEALSNTKATTQAALNSIASKYAQNKLENRNLGIYENLYNYRFDPSGRAVNMNPLYQPNMPTVYTPEDEITHVPVYDDNGKIKGYRELNETDAVDESKQRRGGKTKKNYSQSSIVRAFK
jgi:hypothetical protein